MSDPVLEASAPPGTGADLPRRCVACGYDLHGLAEPPRCPECGLVNVPDALRRQVWDIVDARPWFFSGFFNLFQKRPPGWWWSLDRPGDVARSVRFAIGHTIATVVLVIGAVSFSDSARLEVSYATTYTTPSGNTEGWGSKYELGLLGGPKALSHA